MTWLQSRYMMNVMWPETLCFLVFFHTVLPEALPAWHPPEVYQDPPSPQLPGWTPAVQAPWHRLWMHPGGEERTEGKKSQLTSRVTKRACCWGLSGFTLTVWLDLNSCRSASLLHAWIAPWPVSTWSMRRIEAWDRTAINHSIFKRKLRCNPNTHQPKHLNHW